MQPRELQVYFAFLSTFHVARGIWLYTWIIITEFEYDNSDIEVFIPIIKVVG